jgi:protein-tyrosine-phosphatase
MQGTLDLSTGTSPTARAPYLPRPQQSEPSSTQATTPRMMYVCSGNKYRSRVAEGFALQSLEELGETRVIPCSSGTMVNYLKNGRVPVDIMKDVIRLGLTRNVYNTADAVTESDARGVIDGPAWESEILETAARKRAFKHAYDVFSREEEIFRELATKRFNLKLKPNSEQTTARPEVQAALGMTQKHLQAVELIWENAGMPLPKIVSILGLYATGADNEVADPFGGHERDYIGCAEQIRDLVRKSVPIALGELFGRAAE